MPTFRAWLGADEIEADIRLRTIAVILLLAAFASLAEWYRKPGLLHQGFDAFDTMPAWPLGIIGGGLPLDFFWSKAFLYAVMTVVLLAAGGLLAGLEATVPLTIMAVVWPLDCYLYVSDMRFASNAQHLRLFLTAVFLVSGDRMRHYRIALLAGLFLSAVSRLNPSWVEAQLPSDIPGLPRLLILPAVFITLILPLSLPAIWLSERQRWIRLGAGAMALGVIGWSPIEGCLPALVVASSLWLAFLDGGHAERPVARHDLAVWILIGAAALGTFLPFRMPGDRRLTQEGAYTTLYPLDARRSVSARLDVTLHRGRRFRIQIVVNDFDDSGISSVDCQVEEFRGRRSVRSGPLKAPLLANGIVLFNPAILQPVNPRVLADPYFYARLVNEIRERCAPDALHLTLRVMLNDDRPAHTVVDLDVTAPLQYSVWRHNEWIRLR